MSIYRLPFYDGDLRPGDPDAGIKACREITRHYGTSFYFATQFFPPEIRQGIYAVYAFARIPDEIVDEPKKSDVGLARLRLNEWADEWRKSFLAGGNENPVIDAIVKAFIKFGIPIEDCDSFFRSMQMDLEKAEYNNYKELEDYMYGSAGVIGLMVTRIVGYNDEAAFKYAVKLGYAFQLTNFLRDIGEDYEDLGRIYMPKDELALFGLTTADIAQQTRDRRFNEFMRFQIERNRKIYREALPGIPMLHWRGRLAVRVAYVLYKAILDEIERANYNVFLGRVRTSKRQKVFLSLKALAGVYE